MTSDLTSQEAARAARRAGLPLADERHAGVAEAANHMHSVIATLREIDFGDTPPAAVFRAGEAADAVVSGAREATDAVVSGAREATDAAVFGAEEATDAAL
ncbi:hypothetical protein [Streptomyces sp. NPDC058657]|uniref:hypothetical protein n=1 Tax=unclassified Streptomyces TaxID=2593676 RepID=UPI003652E262